MKGPVGVYHTLPCERGEGTCRGVTHICNGPNTEVPDPFQAEVNNELC